MALKKYTLYFRGMNEKRKTRDLPILSLDLRKMDEYTSNYANYAELYNALPKEVNDYIINEIGYGLDTSDESELCRCFFITDDDYNPIMDVLFNKDSDVIYITPKELEALIISEKMTYEEYQSLIMDSNQTGYVKNEYSFFKYLYDTYVRNEKIEGMIDDYDARRTLVNATEDDYKIAAIACDKDNIMILCKKLSQEFESRRNLALKFHKLFNANEPRKMIDNFSIKERKNKNPDIKELYKEILDNLSKYKESKSN